MLLAVPVKLFFFGTLMDPAVIAGVTGLPLGSIVLKDALIPNFKRFYAKGASFPVLVPTNEPESWVDGVIFETDSEEVIRNLDRYEGNLYHPETYVVYPNGEEPVEARVYIANWDRLSASDTVWTYNGWRQRRYG